MYRCYLTRSRQIVTVVDLNVLTLSDAIIAGYAALEEKSCSYDLDGIEIWQERSILYKTGG